MLIDIAPNATREGRQAVWLKAKSLHGAARKAWLSKRLCPPQQNPTGKPSIGSSTPATTTPTTTFTV